MLKAIVDSLDEVESQYHALYKEVDGKWHLQVEGLEFTPVVRNLKNEAAQNRIKAREAADTLAKYTKLGELEDLQTKLDRIEELEAQVASGDGDKDKLEAQLEARLKTRLAPVQRELDNTKALLQERDTALAQYKEKETRNTIAEAVRAAAKKVGMRESALDDAVLLAERVLEVNDGVVTVRDGNGFTPGVDPHVWLTEMQPKRPHWWEDSVGGGAGGSRNSGGGGVNPWSHDHWDMTAQGRLYRENPARAEQMAKAAGTTIGGARPSPRT